ncbi:CrcB family protein [Naasia sp. SYSU D00948]|uniref:CrcB family protein n=1 Tax=Naasia sp. SYSU D00948 TaxID=2817379 RepID=UPI0027DD3802|nr:CrcB family protein [Naasia sp. SYSU D00948]
MPPRLVPEPPAISARAIGLVALGGAAGTTARYLLTELLPTPGAAVVTLLINVTGAFLLGLLVEVLGRLPAAPSGAEALRLLLGTGLLGGFTTYSALALETVAADSVATSLLYSTATLVLGLAAAAAGMASARRPR